MAQRSGKAGGQPPKESGKRPAESKPPPSGGPLRGIPRAAAELALQPLEAAGRALAAALPESVVADFPRLVVALERLALATPALDRLAASADALPRLAKGADALPRLADTSASLDRLA